MISITADKAEAQHQVGQRWGYSSRKGSGARDEDIGDLASKAYEQEVLPQLKCDSVLLSIGPRLSIYSPP